MFIRAYSLIINKINRSLYIIWLMEEITNNSNKYNSNGSNYLLSLPIIKWCISFYLFSLHFIYHPVPRNSWNSYYQPWKDKRLFLPWSHRVVLNTGLLDWESSALTTRPWPSLYSKAKQSEKIHRNTFPQIKYKIQ